MSSSYSYNPFTDYSTSASSSSSGFSLPNVDTNSDERSTLLAANPFNEAGLVPGSSKSQAAMGTATEVSGYDGEESMTRRRRGIPRSFPELVKRLEVNNEPGLTTTQLMLTNEDLKPVERVRQTWGPWNYVAFWIADSFNINTWMISSSMIISGLSWWQSWLCVWVGYFLAACFIVLIGRVGAVYHIGFPVAARSSFGIFGSLWPVFNRAVMACIWYGVQSWIGGQCVHLMIRAIWNNWRPREPNENGGIANTMEGSGTKTVMWVSFFIFWLCSLPAIWFPVHQIRHLFTIKSYVVPVAGFAFFGWAIAKAGGMGPIVHQPHTIYGSELGWAIVSGIMSSIANFAALICNNPDFTRFAIKPKDIIWSQLITIPTGFAITSFIGIIVSSSSAVIYDTPIWNPLDILTEFLEEGGGGNRTGVFFIATAFSLAQLGTNIAANSVSAGTDLTALAPRWINIRRGGYVCAIVGLVMCPWHLLSSSNRFTLYLSSYSVFMSSVAGVLFCDYYLVRRGFINLQQLYSGKRSGIYWYHFGIHWRAFAAYIAGILINIVGFVGAVGAADVPVGARYIYNLNFFGGFGVSTIVYYLLCRYAGPFPAFKKEGWWEVYDELPDGLVLQDDASESSIGKDEETGLTDKDKKVEIRS